MPGWVLAPDLVQSNQTGERTLEMHLAGPGRTHHLGHVRDTQIMRTC